MRKIVLIVAGGSGTRMNAGIPKQFLLINRRPVLMHTIEVFQQYDPEISLIVVLPEDQTERWKELCIQYSFGVRHEVGIGGETRFHSVQRNIRNLPDDALIAIHDGVRPLVSLATIDRCFEAAKRAGTAVPCVEIPETMRQVKNCISVQVPRSEFKLIQTPQVFKGSILKKAYNIEYHEEFTDDAGVIEKAGYNICLVEGNSENIKITFKKDLIIAEAFLKNKFSDQGL